MPPPTEVFATEHCRLNAAPVDAFLTAIDEEAYAPLAAPHGYTLAPEQLSAWRLQRPVLRVALEDLPLRSAASASSWIHLEFHIPRLDRRADAALIASTPLIPIEFKVGAKKFQQLGCELFAEFRDHYHIMPTRSMRAAWRWIRRRRRGTKRVALLASSSAQRFKPHAIDTRTNIDPVDWFLSPPRGNRSSLYRGDAAMGFQVLGLELDWTSVAWDADLRWRGSDWSYRSFRGASWTDVKKPERRQYLQNAYLGVAYAGQLGDRDLRAAGVEARQEERYAYLIRHAPHAYPKAVTSTAPPPQPLRRIGTTRPHGVTRVLAID